MQKSGHAQDTRQIAYAGVTVESPRECSLHALELVRRAIVNKPVDVPLAGRGFDDDVRGQTCVEHWRQRRAVEIQEDARTRSMLWAVRPLPSVSLTVTKIPAPVALLRASIWSVAPDGAA
jgi:hypothetical protein